MQGSMSKFWHRCGGDSILNIFDYLVPLVPRVLFGRFPTFSALISYCCRNSGKNFPKIVTPIVEIRTANMQVRLLGRCGDKNSSSYWLSNPSLTQFFASHRSVFFINFRLASVYRKMLSGHLGGFIKKNRWEEHLLFERKSGKTSKKDTWNQWVNRRSWVTR